MAGTGDWDDIAPDEEENLGNIDEEEVGTDFSSVESFAEEDGDVDEDFPEEEKVRFASPPSMHEGHKMLETFTNIYEASTELASMMNVVIANAKDIIHIGNKKSGDIKTLVREYNGTFTKVNNQLTLIQQYFEVNKHMADELSSMKTELSEEFTLLNENILSAQEEYVKNIKDSSEDLAESLRDLSKNIDLDLLSRQVSTEIHKIVKESSIKEVIKTFKKFDKAYYTLEETVLKLSGVDGKKGLLDDLNEEVEQFDSKLLSMKKSFNWFGFFMSFLAGGSLAIAFAIFYLSANYERRLAETLVVENIKINDKWSGRLEELRSASRGYLSFAKKYGISENAGFGYFEDTGKPYFYFDANSKPFKVKDRIYLELDPAPEKQ